MTTFETERLALTSLCEDDGDALHAAFSDAETLRHWHMLPTTSVAESRERAKMHVGVGVFAIREKGSADAIGFAGFGGDPHPRHQQAFGYLVAKEHWGKGYAVEASRAVLDYGFAALQIPAAELWIYDGNDQSRRVAEKLGARYRGVFTGLNLVKGPRVTHVYEIPHAPLPKDVVRVIPVLRVTDLSEGVAWYRDRLAFALEWSTPYTASLVSPGWLPNAATIRLQPGDRAPSRLALAVPEGFDEIAAAFGMTPEDQPWGMRELSVTDPWGNVLLFETPTAR